MGVKFTGIPEGAAVNGNAALLGGTSQIAFSVATWKQIQPGGGGVPGADVALPAATVANAVTITIQTTTLKLAPDVVYLTAALPAGVDFGLTPAPVGSLCWTPEFHNVTWVWDFDDPGTFNPLTPLDFPTPWQTRNRAYGQETIHVFSEPGVYNIKVAAIGPNGVVARGTIQHTVGDLVAATPQANTIVLAADGNFAGAPTHNSALRFTDLTAALDAYVNINGNGLLWIKGGLDYGVYDGNYFLRGTLDTLHLRSYNGRPNIRTTLTFRGVTAETRMVDIDLNGNWDTTNGTGAYLSSKAINIENVRFLILHRCRLNNRNMGFEQKNTQNSPYANPWVGQEAIHALLECDIRDWKDMGVFLNPIQMHFAMIGCNLKQNPLALGGGKGKVDNNQFHGPTRIASGMQVAPVANNTQEKMDAHVKSTYIYRGCDMFSNTGWSTDDGLPAHQPCIRTSGGIPLDTIIVDRCRLEGGWGAALALADTAASDPSGPSRCMVDKVLIIGTENSRSLMQIGYPGITARNVVMLFPNVETILGNDRRRAWFRQDLDDGSTQGTDPVQVYNYTVFVWLGADKKHDWQGETDFISGLPFINETIENGVYHTVDPALPNGNNAGVFDTTVRHTPNYSSFQYVDSPTPNTAYATPPGTIIYPYPAPGNAAIGAATTGLTAWDDFMCRPRPGKPGGPAGTPSKGALEAAVM